MTVLIVLVAMLALGATRVDANHIVAEEVSEDYLVTHVLNVPLALTKLLTTEVSMFCRLTAGTDHPIRAMRSIGGQTGVNSAGAVSRTTTTRLRIIEASGGAPYQGSLKVRCEVRPREGQFRVGEPPAQQPGTGSKAKARDEYLQPGPTLTPDGAIAVEGTFP